MNRILTFILVLCSTLCFGQEICNNAIDDDGDGLIDLNDPQCYCNGAAPEIPSIIPNPSFENYNQCPDMHSELNYCTNWMQATDATSDYMNTCGYIFEAATGGGLVPFPDGNGIVGGIFLQNYKEYIGACLISAMEAGTQYQITFDIASLPIGGSGETCNDGEITFGAVNITVYGAVNCSSMPVITQVNPTDDPAWTILGSSTYVPVGHWGKLTITFTPGQDINVIMLGAPELLPSSYPSNGDVGCMPYFFFDGLTLNESSLFGANITASGHYCSNDLVLTASPTVPLTTAATYQWYKGGIAVIGATGSSYAVPANPASLGTYSVKIIDGANCYVSTSYTTIATLPAPSVTEVGPTCITPTGTITVTTPANFYSFDNGVTWSSSPSSGSLPVGAYDVRIKTASGCISDAVTTVLEIPDLLMAPWYSTTPPQCGVNGSITIEPMVPASQYSFDNGATWTTNPTQSLPPGMYTIIYKNAAGCMSQQNVVWLEEFFMPPANYTTVEPTCTTGGTITITTPADEYSFDNGVTWTANPVATNLPPGSYIIRVRNTEGCTSWETYAWLNGVFVNPPDYTTVSPTCGTPGSITITTTAAQYSFDGGLTWGTNPTAGNLSQGYYELVIIDSQGCTSYTTGLYLSETFFDAPAYDVIEPACDNPGSITITTAAAEYSFDGGITWGTNPVLSNIISGGYDVMIRDSSNCTSNSSYIYIYPADPVPAAPTILISQPGSCTGTTGNINITSFAFQYSFDNGATWGNSNTSVPLSPGTYTVLVRNFDLCESDPTTAVINTPLGVPDAPVLLVTDPTCTLATGSITVSSASPFYSFNNGTTWQASNTISGLLPGNYLVKVKNDAGCESVSTSATISAETGPPPVPTVSLDQPDCNSPTGTVTVTSTAVQYSYDNGATWSTQSTSAALAVGTYNIRIKNAAGCESPALSVLITPDVVPLPGTANVDYCQYAVASPLTAWGTNLLWYDTPTGGAGSASAPVPSTASTGVVTYYVSQSISGCEGDRAPVTVTVSPTPLAPIADDELVYCQNAITLPLTAAGTNLRWYTVATGGTGSAIAPTPSSAAPGTTIYYVSQSINTCESDRTAIPVIILPTPPAPYTVAHVVYSHHAPTAALSTTGTDIQWFDADLSQLSTAPTPSSANIGTTIYYVGQTINGCDSPLAEIIVEIIPDYIVIEYPKFFTPNGDGINEGWNIVTPKHGIEAMVYIFDRYGKLLTQVFAPGKGWNGIYNGHALPASDYWFIVQYTEYGATKEFKSHFSLVR